MTTSRPYRKALDLREARMRLEDAAGTQLDERLVKAFLDGLETDANPPLPGDDVAARLWLPGRPRRVRATAGRALAACALASLLVGAAPGVAPSRGRHGAALRRRSLPINVPPVPAARRLVGRPRPQAPGRRARRPRQRHRRRRRRAARRGSSRARPTAT